MNRQAQQFDGTGVNENRGQGHATDEQKNAPKIEWCGLHHKVSSRSLQKKQIPRFIRKDNLTARISTSSKLLYFCATS
jgi:hypothetical protein